MSVLALALWKRFLPCSMVRAFDLLEEFAVHPIASSDLSVQSSSPSHIHAAGIHMSENRHLNSVGLQVLVPAAKKYRGLGHRVKGTRCV
jgi:hypothetical protein